MLDRNDMDTSDESKEEKSDTLVKSTQKPASVFDNNLAALMDFYLLLHPTATTAQSSLIRIPNAMWLHILSFLNLETNNFNISRKLSPGYNPLGRFFQSHLRDVRLKQLLQHVVYGNQTEAEKIIKSNPTLLLLRGTVEDYSFGMDEENHRKNEGTAYQLALGAEDVGFHKDEVCMAEMIRSYLIELPAGKAEIAKQTMQRFPVGWEAEEDNRVARDSAALHQVISVFENASEEDCRNASEVDKTIQNILCGIAIDTLVVYNRNDLKKIIKAISKADSENDFETAFDELRNYLYQNAIIKSLTFNFAVLKAIFQFRNYLEPRGIISTGKQLNVGLLDEAFKLYDRKYKLFGNRWDSAKNMLFWQKVIGYIQRFLPACYAQAFAQGIYYIVQDGEELKRSLEFQHDKNIFFYPLDSLPRSRLGYDYVAGGTGGGLGAWAAVWVPASCSFYLLVSGKNNIVATYYATARQSLEESMFDNVVGFNIAAASAARR
jgi:hypothetical protein